MDKFNIILDEKCTIWRRYTIEIEADNIEEAKKKVLKGENNDSPVEYLLNTAEPMSKKENAAISEAEYLMPEDEWKIIYNFDDEAIKVREIIDDNCYKIKKDGQT